MAPPARAAIADQSNEGYFSAASVWEIGLKIGKGKLRIERDFVALLDAHGFEPLSATTAHAIRSLTLPPIQAILLTHADRAGPEQESRAGGQPQRRHHALHMPVIDA